MACCSVNKTVGLRAAFLQDADMIVLKKITTPTWGGQLRLVMTDGIRPPKIIAQITTNYPDSVLWDLADQVYSSEYSNMFYWYPKNQTLMMMRKWAPQVMAQFEYDFPARADISVVTYKKPILEYADSFVRDRNFASQVCPQCNYQWENCPHC